MQFLGLDIDGSDANFALLNSKKRIIELKTYPLSNVKQLYVQRGKNISLTSALEIKQVLVREKNVKATSKSAIKKTIPFQLKSCTSLLSEQIIYTSIIKRLKNNSSDLFFYLTTKKSLSNHLTALCSLNIDPDYVSSQSQALNRFARLYFPTIKELFLLHIGKTKTIIVHVDDGLVVAHHSAPFGLTKIFDPTINVSSNLNFLDFSTIAKKDNSVHLEALDLLEKELKKSFLNFSAQGKKVPLFITGQIHSMKNFDLYIQRRFPEMFSEILHIDREADLPYAISIGLSLDTLLKDKSSLQFRQEEFTSKKQLRRARFSLFLFTLSICILSLLLFFTSEKIFKNKEANLLSQLSTIEKSEQISSSDLSFTSIPEKIKKLNEKIINESKKSPYLSLAPRVCYLLEWLSTNPLFKEANKEIVEILTIDYDLVSYPTIENPKKSCLAKVALSLKIKDPEIAKKIHESISKTSTLVDLTKEITWEELTVSTYHTSFFLKNKTFEEFYD
jgi:hypothetical protein